MNTTLTQVNRSLIEVAQVESYLAAGTKLMINVRNEGLNDTDNRKYVPYISYYHVAFSETRFSVRVAWPVTDFSAATGKMNVEDGVDDRDFFTGKWEVMTIPSVQPALSQWFICNGVPRTAGDWAAIDNFNGYANGIDKTIMLGYMTHLHYEGAILKYNLWDGLPPPPSP